jgi:transcription elongation factor Elf1
MNIITTIPKLPKKLIFGNERHINLSKLGQSLGSGESAIKFKIKKDDFYFTSIFMCCSCGHKNTSTVEIDDVPEPTDTDKGVLMYVLDYDTEVWCKKCGADHTVDYDNLAVHLTEKTDQGEVFAVGENQLSLFEQTRILQTV